MLAYFKALLLTAILAVLADPAVAQPDRPTIDNAVNLIKTPMVFYLARGKPDACGPGCNEWIAAEGEIDAGAAPRFRKFLASLPGNKPPIFLQSRGGIQQQAMAIGMLLRERGMTAGVSRTVPFGCVAENDEACQALKRSGKKLPAVLSSASSCSSACVLVLIGAKARQVPPGARLGVHSPKLVYVRADGRVLIPQGEESPGAKTRSAILQAEQYAYVHAAGIDARMLEVASKIPHEHVYWLTRDDIVAFKIDPREFQETRWVVSEPRQQPLAAIKFVLEAKGENRNEHRISVVQIACVHGHGLRITYFRGLSSDDIPARRQVNLTIGGRRVLLSLGGTVSKIDAFDTGGSFDTRFTIQPIELFDAAEDHDSIDMIETDSRDAKILLRTTRLSTAGLSEAFGTVRRNCVRPS